MSALEAIRVERHGSSALVTLWRPERANALRVRDAEELAQVLWELDDDPSVRAIILAGTDRYFCAGADLSDVAEGELLGQIDRLHRALRHLVHLRTPTIAAVRGVAVGAGLNLALACDLVVAGEHTKASEIFIRRGLTLDFAGSALLVARLGPHRAKELAFFGRELTQAELEQVVNRVVPDADVVPCALAWGAELATHQPAPLTLAKRLIDDAATSVASALEREVIAQFAVARDPTLAKELERWRH